MIKTVLLTFLFVTALFSAEPVWQKDLATALDMAKKEQKTVMVMVEGEHCRWCKKMKRRTLNDEKVLQRLQSYIVVKVFQEDNEAVKTLPQIDGVPTIFFMTAEKKILMTVVGYENAEDFLTDLDDVEKKTAPELQSTSALKWMDDLNDAFHRANSEKKQLIVMVEDEHCRWCKKMKTGALSDERVKKNFVSMFS